VVLKKESEDDIKARDSCAEGFRTSEATKKETEHAIKGLGSTIDELSGAIEAAAGIIEKSASDIKTAEESLAQATEQRKEDNAEFVEAIQLNNQAVELIQKAKDKLNAYYNPSLVTEEEAPAEKSEDGLSFLQTEEEQKQLPAGMPEMASGKREAKGGANVLAMMDQLAGDINKDTTALEQGEAVAQKDYEYLAKDLTKQIEEAKKAGVDAAASKAAAEEDKQTAESSLSMKEDELKNVSQTIADLHAKCDFITGAFEERKSARENEIAGLEKAKAVLAGAKFD